MEPRNKNFPSPHGSSHVRTSASPQDVRTLLFTQPRYPIVRPQFFQPLTNTPAFNFAPRTPITNANYQLPSPQVRSATFGNIPAWQPSAPSFWRPSAPQATPGFRSPNFAQPQAAQFQANRQELFDRNRQIGRPYSNDVTMRTVTQRNNNNNNFNPYPKPPVGNKETNNIQDSNEYDEGIIYDEYGNAYAITPINSHQPDYDAPDAEHTTETSTNNDSNFRDRASQSPPRT